MNSDWPVFSVAATEAVHSLGYQPQPDSAPDNDVAQADFSGRERQATRAERVGQNLFREAVLTAYEFRCCITGLSLPKLLVASHIVPWRSDPKNRLNPANGLCLSSLHDRVFDMGLITIREDWTVAISPSVRNNTETDDFCRNAITDYEGCKITLPDKFRPNSDFLAHHRKEIFLR